MSIRSEHDLTITNKRKLIFLFYLKIVDTLMLLNSKPHHSCIV